MRFHPGNIYRGSFSRTQCGHFWVDRRQLLRWLNTNTAGSSMEIYCKFKFFRAGHSSTFNATCCCDRRWRFKFETNYGALITSLFRYIRIFYNICSVNSTKHFTILKLPYWSKSGRGVSRVHKLHRVKNWAWRWLQIWIQTKPPDWPFSNHYRDVQVHQDKSVWFPLVTSHDAFWNIRNLISAHGSHK
jgi:hypothetical protein